MGAEDHSEESQLLHGRAASLFLAQRSERVCNSSVRYETTVREINTTRPPLPPAERPSDCIAHLFSWMQPGKHTHLLPTWVLSIFASWALLHLPQTSWAAQMLHEQFLPLSPWCPWCQGWGRPGRAEHQVQLPPSCPWWAQHPPALWMHKPDHPLLLWQPRFRAKLERLGAISYLCSHRRDKNLPIYVYRQA